MSPRAALQMSDEEVDAFLHDHWAMVLGTAYADGRPHLVTVSYGFMDGMPVFTTYAKAQKAVNLRRDPRITCLVEDVGSTYGEIRGVLLHARAVVLTDPAQVLDALGCVMAQEAATGRHVPPDAPDGEHVVAKRIAVLADVERVASWDHRRLRGAH